MTSEQDVNLRSCEVDDHPSVLVHDLTFVGDLVLSNLGVPYIQTLIEKSRQCPCRQFNFDPYGDHIQTCPCQSATFPTHEWRVYKLSLLLSSVGHKVKTHRMTPATGNEHGDIQIKDYVILPHGEDDRLPPHTLVMDVTMTHDLYGRTTQCTNGALTPIVFLPVTVSTSGRVYEERGFYKSAFLARVS